MHGFELHLVVPCDPATAAAPGRMRPPERGGALQLRGRALAGKSPALYIYLGAVLDCCEGGRGIVGPRKKTLCVRRLSGRRLASPRIGANSVEDAPSCVAATEQYSFDDK